MYFMKKVLAKSALSFFAGIASAIGVKLVGTVWCKCFCDESNMKEEKIFS